MHESLDLSFVVPRAQVSGDDEFVVEPIGTLAIVVDVHVAMFVDQILAVFRGDEGHLADQDPGLEENRIVVQALRVGIAGIRENWDTCFGRDLGPRHFQIADFVPAQILELWFQFISELVHDEAKGIDRVSRWQRRHDVFTAKMSFVAGKQPNQFAGHGATVKTPKHLQHVPSGVDRRVGHVDHWRVHLHHPPTRDIRRQSGDVVEVSVRNEHRGGTHEVPRLNPDIKQDFQFVHSPTRLHGGARVSFDRQTVMVMRQDGYVFDHRAGERKRCKIAPREAVWLTLKRINEVVVKPTMNCDVRGDANVRCLKRLATLADPLPWPTGHICGIEFFGPVVVNFVDIQVIGIVRGSDDENVTVLVLFHGRTMVARQFQRC